MRLFRHIVTGTLLAATLATSAAAQTTLYVATDGRDSNPGTIERPFATLERAREAVRALHQADRTSDDGARVYLRAGTYVLSQTFELTAADSGHQGAPVVYQAYRDEEVRLAGGPAVQGFVPVTDPGVRERLDAAAREHVLQLDLRALGMTDFGQLKPRGFPQPIRPTAMELFFNDRPMTLARWPNEGYARTGKVLESGSVKSNGNKAVNADDASKRGGVFVFDDARIKRWASTPDAWMHGFWCWDWADEYVRVAAVDAEGRTVRTATPHTYGYKADRRFYVRNVLEELDVPGEYWIDRDTGMLYFWPPGRIDDGQAAVSLLESPLIALQGASHIELRNLILERGRGDGVAITGGDHLRVLHCTLRNLGNCAVTVRDGLLSDIQHCHIYNTGEGGIAISGGDRASLSGGTIFATHNEIHRSNRLTRTYRPAIRFTGVGHVIAHNRIYDAPHSAIIFGAANDCDISFNEIFDVCTESEDAGAIYTGRDWTVQGITIRYNFIHRIRGKTHTGRQAIYIDDAAGGMIIYGNVLCDVQRAILIGGGRDNRIENNVIVNCDISVHIDNRGMNWMSYHVADGGIMPERLRALPYRAEPWASRYPHLVNILEDQPAVPKRNVVRHNVIVASGKLAAHIADAARQHGTIELNLETEDDPGFVDAAGLNFQFDKSSGVWSMLPGFQRIPFDQIGPGIRDRSPRGP